MQTNRAINDLVTNVKRDSRIFAFIFFSCGLSTNKYLLAALYSTYGLKTPWVNGVIWLHTAFWIGAGIFAWANLLQQHRKLTNALFGAAISIIFFQVLVLVDRTLLPLVTTKNQEKAAGLIFEPHSRVRYKTSEFDVIAEINSFGIRDHEYSLTKQSRYRILAFGDSFTFGWGVDIDSSWPKVLERELKDKGLDVEVLNCGRGGASSTEYREYAERAIPLLRPNLVIVGLLQADDLAQKIEELTLRQDIAMRQRNSGPHFDILGILEHLPAFAFKNASALLRRKSTSQTISIHQQWLEESHELILQWKGLTKLRYDLLSDSVRSMFESGNLNPGLIQGGVEFPDVFLDAMNVRNPRTIQATASMVTDLKAIHSTCRKAGADLMVVSIPVAPFVNHEAVKYQEMGFIFTDEMLKRNTIDSVYASISGHVEVPFLGFTDLFRRVSKSETLYFRFDGHLTPAGHRLLGSSLTSFLINNDLKKTSIVHQTHLTR